MKKAARFFLTIIFVLSVLLPNSATAVHDTSCEVGSNYPLPVVSAVATSSGVQVSWEQIDDARLEGYKLVISQNNAAPQYSGDGYLKYITDRTITSYLVDNSRAYNNGDFGSYLTAGGTYYFSITAVYNCGHKLAGNAVQVTYPGSSVSTGEYPIPEMTASAVETGVQLNWQKITDSRFKGYKVVISQYDSTPQYPDNGYLAYLTDSDITAYLVKNTYKYYNGDFGYYLTPGETYYFSITAVYKDKKVPGNAVQLEFPLVATSVPVSAKPKEQSPAPLLLVKDEMLAEINHRAQLLVEDKLDQLLAELNQLRDLVKEQQTELNYLRGLATALQRITRAMQTAIQNFIAYGVDNNTKGLGAGERAAVIHSYEKAFGQLPTDEAELEDAIKIANGRWPSKRSLTAEQRALERFQFIYQRLPDFADPHDNAAVTIMAYGLRQRAENRKLESEQRGIAIFQDIYGRLPETTEDWNIMQAITYSGATR